MRGPIWAAATGKAPGAGGEQDVRTLGIIESGKKPDFHFWRTKMLLSRTPNQAASLLVAALAALALLVGYAREAPAADEAATTLSDQQIEDLVRHSYQYVAMYNVNNKFALAMGGWNRVIADTALKDHTMTDIARPNNDTLYVSALLDLRKEPVLLELPAFDSDYVSLMITGYDHYVNIPMSTRLGDFRKPETMLLYTARTENYDRQPVAGVTRSFKATGDFVSAVLRVMPHAADQARFGRIIAQMKTVKAIPLSQFLGGQPLPADPIAFPPVGKTDGDVFENNLLEVMQFVFNHTTFDPDNQLDKAVLALYEPLGVVPGRAFDPAKVVKLDGKRVRAVAERVAATELARTADPAAAGQTMLRMFLTKDKMDLGVLVNQSVIGPIGLPAVEAVYPPVPTADGAPMNALNDYVIRMSRDQLPPATAFWSVTLYDMKNGFFIPNERKKYSVGKNAGMRLDQDGGIVIHIAAEKPAGVPEENWLPIERRDEVLGAIMRVYVPDLEKLKTWTAPRAVKIEK
jgi:hypothetical protein